MIATVRYALTNPTWATLLLAVQVPFQGLLNAFHGMGYAITAILLTAFLVLVARRRNGEHLRDLIAGSITQKIVIAFVVVVVALPLLRGQWDWLETGQRLSRIVVVAAFAYQFRERRGVEQAAWALLIAMTVFALMSEGEWLAGARYDPLRLGGFHNSLSTATRFAFVAILPVMMGIALAVTKQWGWRWLVASACTAIIVLGVASSGSRVASAAIMAGVALIFVVTRLSPKGVATVYICGLVIWAGVAVLAVGEPVWRRAFSTTTDPTGALTVNIAPGTDRVEQARAAITTFQQSPIIGARNVAQTPDNHHSGYLATLARNGLIGTVPLAALTVVPVWVYWQNRPRSLWGSAFVASFAGMALVSVFADYLFERYIWVALGYFAMLERQKA